MTERRPSNHAVGARVNGGPAPKRKAWRTQEDRIARQQTRPGYRELCAPDGTVMGHAVLDRLGNVSSIELRTD